VAVIGIIGANGQVGSAVSLYLSQMPGIQVVPICRTMFGSSFLRKCGLECRHGILGNETAEQLLKGCDVIADFSLPKGSLSEIRAAIKRTLTYAIRDAEGSARFVYISTMIAFGMSGESERFRRYAVARSIYGASKRYGERVALYLGRKHKREVYVLRLGQVHGELQSTTRGIKQGLRNETTYVPSGPAYTVFVFTIAEALVRISEGREQPGSYTLVSVPAWSWKEIHEFYCKPIGLAPEIIEYDNNGDFIKYMRRRALTVLKRLTTTPLIKFAEKHREVIASYFLFAFPNLEEKLAAIRLKRRAVAEISSGIGEKHYKPYQPYRGVVPGRRLASLSDCRFTMKPVADDVERLLQQTTRIKETTF
jgi:nucleoside-diphosphate-sugar epimerase